MAKLKIRLNKSASGQIPAIRETVRSLGLKRIGHEVIQEDTDSIRGMCRAVRHLVTVEEVK